MSSEALPRDVDGIHASISGSDNISVSEESLKLSLSSSLEMSSLSSESENDSLTNHVFSSSVPFQSFPFCHFKYKNYFAKSFKKYSSEQQKNS